MGAIAGLNIAKLMAVAMQHDLSARIQSKMDQREYLTMKTMGLANQKAAKYQELAATPMYDTNNQQSEKYKKINAMLHQLEQQEAVIQHQDKLLDMQIKQLEQQLKMAEQRAESADKLLGKNIDNFAPKW